MGAWWLHSMICKFWPAQVLGTRGAPATVAGKCVGGKDEARGPSLSKGWAYTYRNTRASRCSHSISC